MVIEIISNKLYRSDYIGTILSNSLVDVFEGDSEWNSNETELWVKSQIVR